jgi:DNA-binding NtrC family response regulator
LILALLSGITRFPENFSMVPSAARGISRSPRDKFRARVLIVDDEPLVCWSLAAGLRLAGFDAVTAVNGAEALALARLPPHPAVVLLDTRLSPGEGTALLRELRMAAPACRLLWLTTEGQNARVPAADGITVITKPFDLSDVVRIVSDAVGHLATNPA